MTRLEWLITRVANNRYMPEEIKEIESYPSDEVEKVITDITSVAPWWAIQNINQANVWGKK
jgi:hypothetical protein